MIQNIPEVKLGIVAVSRDCFPIALSEKRRAAIVAAYGQGPRSTSAPSPWRMKHDMLKAVEDVRKAAVQRAGGVPGQLRPRNPRNPDCQELRRPRACMWRRPRATAT